MMSNLVELGSGGSTSAAGNRTDGATCIWEKLLPEKQVPIFFKPHEYTFAVATALSLCSSIFLMRNHGKSKLRTLTYSDSYMFFKVFYFAMFMRVFLPKLCRGVLKYVNPKCVGYIGKIVDCEECALLESFLMIMEIEILTHVCINRYVVAKYIYNGWPLNKNHVRMYLILCFFFAFAYSLPPVFGLGKYALDIDCETCSLDMIMPKRWRHFVMAIWLLRSVKPAMFMLVMLFWARSLEVKFTDQMKLKYDAYFTRIVELVTMCCLMHWSPIFFLRGNVIFSQLLGEIDVHPKILFDYGMLLYELTPWLVNGVIVSMNACLADKQRPFNEATLMEPVQRDDKKEE